MTHHLTPSEVKLAVAQFLHSRGIKANPGTVTLGVSGATAIGEDPVPPTDGTKLLIETSRIPGMAR